MSNVNINRGSVLDGLDNPTNSELLDYVRETREYKPPALRVDWRVEFVRGGVAVLSVLMLWVAFGIWKSFYCWNAVNWIRCDGINNAEPLAVGLLLLLAGVVACWRTALRGFVELQLGVAQAARIATTFNRFGNPQRVDLLKTPEFAESRYGADIDLKRATAPDEWAHAINNWSPSITVQQPAALKGGEMLALPDAPLQLTPLNEWLAWVDRSPHLMIAGRTEAGKSTHAEAIIAQRLGQGEQIVVIDPHWQPGKWFGLPAITVEQRGEDVSFEPIFTVFGQLLREMMSRYEEYRQGRSTESFPRLTVFVDEVPAIVEQTFELTARGKRIHEWRWWSFARRLGSEARKVRISCLLSTQSVNCEDIQLNSQQRENYPRLALGNVAADLLAELKDKKQRDALTEALRGRSHPAAMEYKLGYYALNNDGIPDLAHRRPTSLPALWTPPTRSVSSTGETRRIVPVAERRNGTEQRDGLIRALFRKGHKVRFVGAIVRHYGFTVETDRLIELRREVLGDSN